ncbi:DEAD/DEAH box helicase family protein [Paenibacillus popilliae]|uniref:DEAD/DEAH box helicase n=1 Tax=Paenibacillus popilliae TaxID=78057 RepID=A0ABY3AGK3_PAEPP|nr:DEAD/DEAH box helicase family protein [Paenibacillus sp. SDF0028]TQR40168.1 DEAD/DEAH box helicase [Paenibacillus sp. SDF0028]
MIDFGKLLEDSDEEVPIHPKEIFDTSIRDPKFSYLRGDQQEILSKWFDRRDTDDDLIIKMNTGAGKTTVGLLLLQSSLNEGFGPALYLCLDNQLVDQVIEDGSKLGIRCVAFGADNSIPIDFINNNAVLVTTFQKLFNAKSVFGIQGDVTRMVTNVGSIVVDDAHAALSKAREVFTLSFKSTHSLYRELAGMFMESLKAQSLGTATDIIEGSDKFSILMVPYWSWIEKVEVVTQKISVYARDHNDDQELKFKWAIVRDFLKHYHMLISADKIEITPKCLPIQKIPSFKNAKRRVFMSATLNDDSALIKDMQVSKNAVLSPLSPESASDIGERMILSPFLIDSSLNTAKIAETLAENKDLNVVSLVASDKKAKLWENNNFKKPIPDKIKTVLGKLSSSVGNHVVLSNRYDGVDLPDDMCRILIIHDLPNATTLLEQFSLYARPESKMLKIAQAQKIEQGLGRAVRSVNDYCVVLLCGSDLVSFVSTNEFDRLVSPQTVAQIKLGAQIVGLIKQETAESPIKVLLSTISRSIARDEKWVKLHKQKIAKSNKPYVYVQYVDSAVVERQAFDLACSGQLTQAGEALIQFINQNSQIDDTDKSWFMQLAASYLYEDNRERAMEVQLSSHRINTFLLKPPAGIQYSKITSRNTVQAVKIKEFISGFNEPNGIILHVSNLLDKIAFAPGTSKQFENAFAELGRLLGFESQEPEREFGVGSDVLWNLYEDDYLIIEAKNEVEISRTEIYKSESEQISNSMNWFSDTYVGMNGTPVLVHPSNKTHREAFAPSGTVVLLPQGLMSLTENVKAFFRDIAGNQPQHLTVAEIANKLTQYKMNKRFIYSYLTSVE